jgi:hypothetical protein
MRMIDADRLKAEIMGWCVVTDDLFGMGKHYEREIVFQAIEESPTIDAMPVVRCKDCKHYNTIGCSKGFGWCENIDRGTSDNFYCAEAAVKMGAQDLRKEEAERLEGMK